MPKRRVRTKAEDIKPGVYLWVIGWSPRGGDVPVRVQVKSHIGTYDEGYKFKVHVISDHHLHSSTIYPGDSGIRPLNYDQRPTQVWPTKRQCVRHMQMWEGKNPNFMTGF